MYRPWNGKLAAELAILPTLCYNNQAHKTGFWDRAPRVEDILARFVFYRDSGEQPGKADADESF